MSVVEHELKRHDVWREELRKKSKAYILIKNNNNNNNLPLLIKWSELCCVCVCNISSLTLFCARESAPENGSLRRDQDKAQRKYQGLLAKQEQLLRGRLIF